MLVLVQGPGDDRQVSCQLTATPCRQASPRDAYAAPARLFKPHDSLSMSRRAALARCESGRVVQSTLLPFVCANFS